MAQEHKDGYVMPERYEYSDEGDVTGIGIKINVRTVSIIWDVIK